MLDFSNTQVAFSSKSNSDLRLAWVLFTAISNKSLVSVLKGATNAALSVNFPVGWAVKPTLYRHFVGGETIASCASTVAHLAQFGVHSILDYSAEAGQSQADIDAAFAETIRSIEAATANSNISFTVFKPSAMTTDTILEKASSGATMTDIEQKQHREFEQRIEALCQKAYTFDVRILVDAEDYAFQPEIDRVTELQMRRFNKKRAIVFNTLQMYRHDRYDYLERLYADAVANDYQLGIKFVRGAYMEKERERALLGGYPSPICATKELTDSNFDNGLRFTVEHIDRIETFCGTHNEASNMLLARLIDESGIAKNDPRIEFAQLYGMSDNISYNLANEGYSVSKYIPYAPVDRVLPYLIRRAEENTSMAGQTSRELGYINSEIARRKLSVG